MSYSVIHSVVSEKFLSLSVIMKVVFPGLLIVTFTNFGVGDIDISDWDIWPMFTPILGINKTSPCYKASLEYIRLLNESLPMAEM